MESNKVWALLLLGAFLYLSQSSSSTVILQQGTGGGANNSNLANLIDADVSFTGLDKYLRSTSLTGELVRVFRLNGGRADLGTVSLNSGTLNVDPNINYVLYYFMNSTGPDTDYYVDMQDYTAKLQDSTDNLVGEGCSIDKKPVVTVRNSAGQTQTATSNAQAVSANTDVNIEIDIKSHSEKCYGTPDALTRAAKGNAACFSYNSNAFRDIKSNTRYISSPRSVNSLNLGTVKCFDFAVLENAAADTLSIQLLAGATEPTIAHNISIYTDDIGFDLNSNTLAEIWDFTDEEGTQLSRIINSTPDGVIYIS